MFYHRPKKITLKTLLKDYNEYKALKQFYSVFNPYITTYKELDNLKLVSHNSLFNIVKQRPNRIFLDKKIISIHPFFSSDSLKRHIMQIGTTGMGKSHLYHSVSQHASVFNENKKESALMITNIDNNELKGFLTLSVIVNDDYEVLIQYKGNKLFIYIYFTHPDYFIQLNYNGKNIEGFYSSFNQTIDIISNNIAFLLSMEKFNNDYKDILEQDISAEDKITLANMLNI